MTRRRLLAAGLGLLATPAPAQELPGRAVTLVVPFSAGTVVDTMARAFAGPFSATRWAAT